MSLDEELGYVYLPVEVATSDYYGGHRLGDNLFSSSLVCLTLGTGIGCGVVLDGEIWRGAGHLAGEFGHVTLREDGLRNIYNGVTTIEEVLKYT